MQNNNALHQLLAEFFDLPPGTHPEDITQDRLPTWDSLAMVQLIAELQGTFSVDFDLDEIQYLRSYSEIRAALSKKGVSLTDNPLRPF